MSAITSIGHWVAEHPWQTAGIVAGTAGLVGAGVLLAGCGDNTPPPTPTDAQDGPLIDRLRTSGYSNRQQTDVLSTIHLNNYDHAEAGNMLGSIGQHMWKSDAITAWHLTKANNRDAGEITGLVQALDAQTYLDSSDIARVTNDVIETGIPASQAVNFFVAANANPYTSTSQDLHYFEKMLGLRYPGWSYDPGVVYDPYPVYVPDPGYGYDPGAYLPTGPTSPGDDPGYGGGYTDPGYGGGYTDPGYGGTTSPGDDPTYSDPGYGGGYSDPGYGGGYTDPGYGGGSTSPGDDSSTYGNPDFQ